MKYSLTLTIDDKESYDILSNSIKGSARSTVKLERLDGKTVVEIESKDSTSLRAMLNSITKLLTVKEKMEGL